MLTDIPCTLAVMSLSTETVCVTYVMKWCCRTTCRLRDCEYLHPHRSSHSRMQQTDLYSILSHLKKN